MARTKTSAGDGLFGAAAAATSAARSREADLSMAGYFKPLRTPAAADLDRRRREMANRPDPVSAARSFQAGRSSQ